MAYDLHDTICAVATAVGGAARGMVRVSGAGALPCVARCVSLSGEKRFEDVGRARALAGALRLPGFATPAPCDLLVWPTARSYTRQPVVELHTFGSPPVLEAALDALCRAGARPAQPGEFTLRAFLAGRIDLTQAEAVLGVIDADDDLQFDTALEQLAGGLAGPLRTLREALLGLLAHVEAGLDFADEGIEFVSSDQLEATLRDSAGLLDRLARQMVERRTSRPVPRMVLVGRTNVGKSSLLNALAGGTTAITSEEPETTRDYLMVRVDLGDGVLCDLVDTAGSVDRAVETAAASAARDMTSSVRTEADVEIVCLDASRPLEKWEQAAIDGNATAGHSIVVLTKADRPRVARVARSEVATSSRTGQGIERLRRRLRREVTDRSFPERRSRGGRVVAETAARCRESLREAADALGRARRLANNSAGDELVALEIRMALDELGKVVGAVQTEDVLDRVFSRFCIGK